MSWKNVVPDTSYLKALIYEGDVGGGIFDTDVKSEHCSKFNLRTPQHY